MGVAAWLLVLAGAAGPTSDDLLAQVQQEIGEARCNDSSQCRSLALGHRSCGGPELYLAYSTLNAAPQRLARLERLAEAHRSARRAQNEASGRRGICVVLPDPGAQCSAQTQRCELAAGTGGAVR